MRLVFTENAFHLLLCRHFEIRSINLPKAKSVPFENTFLRCLLSIPLGTLNLHRGSLLSNIDSRLRSFQYSKMETSTTAPKLRLGRSSFKLYFMKFIKIIKIKIVWNDYFIVTVSIQNLTIRNLRSSDGQKISFCGLSDFNVFIFIFISSWSLRSNWFFTRTSAVFYFFI